MQFPCFLDKSPQDLYYTRINMEYIYVSYIVLLHCHCFPFLQIYNVLCSTVASPVTCIVLNWNTYYTICVLTCLVVMFFFFIRYEKVQLSCGTTMYYIVGYQTVYAYYAYPELLRPRIRWGLHPALANIKIICNVILSMLGWYYCDSNWCDIWSMHVIGIFALNCFFFCVCVSYSVYINITGYP